MEQTKALNALEPFLALTKSASSPRAAIDLINRATSAPNTFIFTELLLSPNIQALSNKPEHVAHLELLQIFCYGTHASYRASAAGLPALNAAQALKLRQLSLLTLARDPANLTYEKLLAELDVAGTRDLEDLVISAIYAGLLSGTLDPHHQRLSITSVAPLRDVAPSSVPVLIATLKEWSHRCHGTLGALESQIAGIRADAARRHREEKEWNANVERLIEREGGAVGKDATGAAGGKAGQRGGGGGGGMGRKGGEKRGFFGIAGMKGDGPDGEMDIDEEEEEDEGRRDGGARSLKKRGLGGVSLNFGR